MLAVSPPEGNSSFAYAPGDVIASKYQLEQLIGEGGMGAVFRARNTSLDMLVAIKLMRADLNRELFAGRMMAEARAVAKLTHPGIVRVFDVGQTALGDPFIVMELLEGETLTALMDRERRLTPIHAVQLLLPIADALSAAHAKGLVHRDVKPDNVLLVTLDEGMVQPKLLDFGVVQSSQPDGAVGADAGSVVGSPDYMSPEQARGLPHVDSRSDQWSFSVVLYEAIAGAPPFHASDYEPLLRKIVLEEPPTLLDLGAANPALSHIVARGLSKDPARRYASLGQMGRALAAWLADQGISEDSCGVSLEAKWLARQTDPQGLGRASWPPASRAEQVSGVHELGVVVAAPAPVLPTPPRSRVPVAAARGRPPHAASRSLVAATVAFVSTLAACLGFARLSSRPAPVTLASLAASAKVAAKPPEAIASALEPAPESALEVVTVPETAPPTPSKAAPPRRSAKPRPAAPRPKPERPSDILAPLPF